MTKLFLPLAVAFIMLSSCNDSSTATSGTKDSNSMMQKNLEASRAVSKAFETGNASNIDNVVSADYVDHTDRGDMGRDSLKAMIGMMGKEFPDMKMEVKKEMADDDHVFTLMRFTGTSNGQMGMPKGPYDMQAIQVVRLKDGKIVEHWEYMQPLEVMKMMGQMPAGDKMKMPDSSKMNK